MPMFLYRGFDDKGHRVSGSKSLISKTQLTEYLQKRQITGYEIFNSKTVYRRGIYSLVSPRELSVFCKQISVLFYSNITLMEGVLILAEQSDNKQLKTAFGEIYNFMEDGYSFADAMCMYSHIFSPYLLNMVVIGETSGTLDAVFMRMAAYFDKESGIRKKIRYAISYPAILTALMAAIIILLIVKILPMFGNILESMGSQMPVAPRILLDIGLFLTMYAPVAILIILCIVAAGFIYAETEKGRFNIDRLKISIPAYRFISSRVITSRFSRSLAILLKSGVQLINALSDITVLMDNKYLELQLTVAVDKLKDGQELLPVLKEMRVFPPLFLKMFVIGQKTGNLDDILDKSASIFDDEVDDAVEQLTSMIEPVLIIILSVVVGIILLSVMLPMINIMNTIG